jgi:hypothetical protein
MQSSTKSWQTYEEVARAVLIDLRGKLGISDVAGYQELPGASGTTWTVEGSAIRTSDGQYLIIECRRHTTSRLNQEAIGGLAYRILDTGSGGAIVVTPLPLQSGAELVAKAEKIAHVVLDPSSTSDDYLATFMGQNFHGAAIGAAAQGSVEVDVIVRRKGIVVP